MAITWSPRARNPSASAKPIVPVAPVTSTRISPTVRK
jgi:hypothetical protein